MNDTIAAFKAQDIDKARELMANYKPDISSTSSDIVNGILSNKNNPIVEVRFKDVYGRIK